MKDMLYATYTEKPLFIMETIMITFTDSKIRIFFPSGIELHFTIAGISQFIHSVFVSSLYRK